MKFIGIDPGFSGGVVIIDGENISAYKCPKIMKDIPKKNLKRNPILKKKKKKRSKKRNKIEEIKTSKDMSDVLIKNCSAEDFVVIEHVHSFGGEGVVSSFTFGTNYGIWLGILSTLNIKYILVEPQKWMDYFGEGRPKEKKERKEFLRDMAQELYPLEKMPLWKADAVLISVYAKYIYSELYRKMENHD